MLIVSPEFKCSNEMLTITAMLSGEYSLLVPTIILLICDAVPNVWVRPNNQRREADQAKAHFTVPDGDHLTLLNVYNNYALCKDCLPKLLSCHLNFSLDKHEKNWARDNYLSARALLQADNVRTQLQRTMEKFEIDLVSLQDEKKMYQSIRRALVCGFFMQVAHKEGEKGSYLTVKDNQVSGICQRIELAAHGGFQGRRPAPFLRSRHSARMGHF